MLLYKLDEIVKTEKIGYRRVAEKLNCTTVKFVIGREGSKALIKWLRGMNSQFFPNNLIHLIDKLLLLQCCFCEYVFRYILIETDAGNAKLRAVTLFKHILVNHFHRKPASFDFFHL